MLFREDLYEVQQLALEKAQNKDGFAYFLEMGLGKTRVTFYEINEVFGRDECDVAYICCPKSLRASWLDEAKDIEFPHPVIGFEGTVEKVKREMWEALKDGGKVVVLIHFEIMLTKGGDLIEDLHVEKNGKAKMRRPYFAIDESTRIKNPKAKLTKYLHNLKDNLNLFRYRRVLSGAPNPQGPHDLWGQLYFIGAVSQNYYQFRSTYCKMGGYMAKKVVGAQNIDILEMRTGDSVLRAKKSDWTDLPRKLPPVIRQVEMTKRQQQVYRQMMYDFVVEWGESEITAQMAVTAKNKLQQIGSGFMYDNSGEVVHLFEPGEKNPKVEELVEAINERDNKVIVFYNFRPSMDILTKAMEEAGIGYTLLSSRLSDEQYSARKEEFNSDNDVKVALCQISAVKYGFTLLGGPTTPCHSTIFFENSYDLEARVQGEDRNHRHGQKHPVDYTDLAISAEDRAVLKALGRKGNLQEAILSEFSTVKS